MSVKILDCTLRDGGYINNWLFGKQNITEIISNLTKSNLDYTEVGFLTQNAENKEQSLYNSFEKIQSILPANPDKNKLFVMIKLGEFPQGNIPACEFSPLGGIRLIFKKIQAEEALKYAKKLKSKGYKVVIKPTFIHQYNDNELISLIKKINEIEPFGYSIVDSTGSFEADEISRLYNIVSNELDENITLFFHTHNNKNLSFENAKYIIDLCKNRDLIIDCTLSGMGRGAGNLKTEEIAEYLNETKNAKYDISQISKTKELYIEPYKKNYFWGYSKPYYLSAINHCHPNYAKYLSDKKFPDEIIEKILRSIPENAKAAYDEKVAEKLFPEK